MLFERSCRDTSEETTKPITLAAYIDLWLREIAPGKLAKSTIRRDQQDIVRILPALGHYKLTELRPEHFRAFYAELRETLSTETKKPLSEYTVEGVHATLCSILSDAVEGGFPIATRDEKQRRKPLTRRRWERSSPPWRKRASSMRPTSSW